MGTTDKELVIEGQRTLAVQNQSGSMTYSDGATGLECIVSTPEGHQRALKVAVIGGDGNPMTVDSELSPTSTNPVQNAAVTQAINANSDAIDTINQELGTNPPWQKPADWVDIRSGALPNSIYFLAAHKKDYSAYSTFSVFCTVKNNGTYDVYIDGIKYATTASGTSTVINWQTLNLASGYDVTYPQALRTHIVRVTQSDPTKDFNSIEMGAGDDIANKKSVLWVHFNMSYAIGLWRGLGTTAQRMRDSLLEAITSNGGVLKTNSIGQMIAGQTKLKTIPIIDMQNSTGNISYFAYNSYADNLRKVHIRNLKQTGDVANAEPFSYTKIKEIIFEDSTVCWWPWFFQAYCLDLEKVPEGLYHPTGEQPLQVNNGWWNLKDTVLDLSQRTGLTYVNIRGNSNSQRLDGLKGLTVSPSAPLNGNSPQIDVQYTGLDRSALINLFNSLPTVSAGQVCNIVGTTGAADLTTTDLAIATNKGWTVTR